MRGIILINKRQGWTSFDAVNFCKRVFNTREVGHLGTLDPMATGVLAVTIGSANKLFDMFLNKTKTYVAEFTFGYSTDTLDAEGVLEDKSDIIPTLEQIENVLPDFQGEIEQIPPKYSAKKINGKKAYDLAREGKEFELKPSKVTIHNLKILDYNNGVLNLEIDCGAGTYIRSLGRDIAGALGTNAVMSGLRRTQSGVFTVENAIPFSVLEQDPTLAELEKNLIPTESVLPFKKLQLQGKKAERLFNGCAVQAEQADGLYKLYREDEFYGIAEIKVGYAKAKTKLC